MIKIHELTFWYLRVPINENTIASSVSQNSYYTYKCNKTYYSRKWSLITLLFLLAQDDCYLFFSSVMSLLF